MDRVFIQQITESRYNTIMNNILDKPTDDVSQEWKLNALDRCDKCGSQAYVQIVGSTGDLLFCAHHYNKIVNDPIGYKKMMGFMLAILDERDRLIENKSQGKDY